MNICSICRTTETCRWYSGPTCNRCHNQQWREQNPELELARLARKRTKYQTDDSQRQREALNKRNYYSDNRETLIAKVNEYEAAKRLTDPLFKLKKDLRSRLGSVIREQSATVGIRENLGCSFEELKKYLESKFLPGMSWENWSQKGWHIDHIKPLALAQTEEEILRLMHYTNLQPLWAKDNLKKGAKYE